MSRYWNSSDRLLFALFWAAAFHAIVILGIKFELFSPSKIKSSLEVTLVTNRADQAEKEAEFLAQAHQIGGGTNTERVAPRSLPIPESGSGEELDPTENETSIPEERAKQWLTQRSAAKKIIADNGDTDDTSQPTPQLSAAALRQQITEIAAALNRTHSDRAHGPKIVDINQVSAKKYQGAAYERAWQDKIERIGTLNFPDEARRKNLNGSLTLSVGIRFDGAVYSIKVEKSSGSAVLDDAAKRIVRLAAPYSSFPEELRQEGDVLVITRKWTFLADNRIETAP